MSGDTIFPGGIDTAYGAEADYLAGTFDNIDGAGTDFSAFMRRVESATINQQTYGTRVLGGVSGTSFNNTTTSTTLLASAISVPAILRAGSKLTIEAAGAVIINSNTATTVTFTPSLGGTTIANISPILTSGSWTLSANPYLWELRLTTLAVTVGASASLKTFGQIRFSVATTGDFAAALGTTSNPVGITTATVDTTGALAFDLKAAMSVANSANIMTSGAVIVTHTPFIG